MRDVFLSLVVLGFAAGCATATDTSAAPIVRGEGGGGGAGGGAEAVIACTTLDKCPPGMACFNGICADSCNTDQDCPETQRCLTSLDQLCHDRDLATCPDSAECATSQVCANGYCSLMTSQGACGGSPFGNGDGCEAGAVCLMNPNVDGEKLEATRCFVMPPCPDDGKCPIGPYGAVCNDGLFPEKARICLAGLCTSKDNCPDGWSCMPVYPNATYGNCTQ